MCITSLVARYLLERVTVSISCLFSFLYSSPFDLWRPGHPPTPDVLTAPWGSTPLKCKYGQLAGVVCNNINIF